MSKVAVLDPALGMVDGHHAAFIDLLQSSDLCGLELELWCHQHVDPTLTAALASIAVKTKPHFSSDWYEWLDKRPTIEERSAYLALLVKEMVSALATIGNSTTTHLLYHTVDWLHALALNMALSQLGNRVDHLQHILLLMFDPGDSKNPARLARSLDYSLGFRQLLGRSNVQAFASCRDYAGTYPALLHPKEQPSRVEQQLPIHPCFLSDWQSWDVTPIPSPSTEQSTANTTKAPECYLLFMGDPREDKGFLQLPALINALRMRQPEPPRLVVQHTAPKEWSSPEVKATAAELLRLANCTPSLQLHQQYWHDRDLRQAIIGSDAIVLNYDPQRFRHKTSGVLWLAAWLQKTVAVPPDTWLWQEAQRLGCPVIPVEHLKQGAAVMMPVDADLRTYCYRQSIFQPFFNWLKNVVISAPGQSQGSEYRRSTDAPATITSAATRRSALLRNGPERVEMESAHE